MTFFERDFAVLGLDVYDFAGSMLRKVVHLSERLGFYLPLPGARLLELVTRDFNRRAERTRVSHTFRKYHTMETTQGTEQLAIEREVFQLSEAALAS